MSFKSIFRFCVSVGFLAFIVLHTDLMQLRDVAAQSKIWAFPFSIALIIGQIFFLSARWHRFLNVGRHEISFEISVLTNIAGYFANVIFITSVGGVVAKSALAVRYGLSVVQSLFATGLDRLMSLGALLVFSAVALPFLFGVLDTKILIILSMTVGGVVLALLLGLVALRLGAFKAFAFSSLKRSRFLAVMRLYMENYPLMLVSVRDSLIAQVFFFLSVYALFLGGAHGDVNHVQFLALLPVLALISSLPISFGGWGVREGAFIYGLGLIGFAPEFAFLLSLQVGLVGLISPLLVCGGYLLGRRLSLPGFSKIKL